MPDQALSFDSALGQAIAIREGHVSPAELLAEAQRRIDGDDLGAFVHRFAPTAPAPATKSDLGIFYGVPTAIKDIEITRGGFTRFGSRAFRYLWTPFDGPVARATRNGGFVVVGKTATSELAVLPFAQTAIHGPCRNPHDRQHFSGGSSAGAAAAVAAGMLAIAGASDGGGSIRIPASFCGLFGFKPSRDAHPPFYKDFDPIGLSAVNAVCHTVDDAAAMVDVLNGRRYDPRRPPDDSLLAESRRPIAPRTVGLVLETPLADTDPEVASAIERLAGVLESLGHRVEPVVLPATDIETYLPVFGHVMAQAPIPFERFLQPSTRWIRALGRGVDVDEAIARAREVEELISGVWGAVDLWLTPTVPTTAPRIDQWDGLDGEALFRAAMDLGAYTALFNFTGQPAASLPAGRSSAGLAIGAQIVGARGADAQVLALCRQLMNTSPPTARTAR